MFCSILHLCECGVLSSAFYLLDMPMPTCYTVKNIINTLWAVSFSLQWIKFSAQYLPCTFAFRRFDSAFSCISLWNISEQMIYEYRRAYFLVSSSVLLFWVFACVRVLPVWLCIGMPFMFCWCVFVYLMRLAYRNHVIWSIWNALVYFKLSTHI